MTGRWSTLAAADFALAEPRGAVGSAGDPLLLDQVVSLMAARRRLA